MPDDRFAHLADAHALGDDPIPDVVTELAGDAAPELIWRNELGGLTFRIGARYVKWSPHTIGIDLDREALRLRWLDGRHPVPRVVATGGDAEARWLVTEALGGGYAVGDTWRARRSEAIAAIATGLRTLHALAVPEEPPPWAADAWHRRRPRDLEPAPSIVDPVWVHGDACAPNTQISDDGAWVGHVDLGDLGIGDRWADLAVASMSLDWNFGEGHQPEFFEAYGIAPDPERIAYYRRLWDAEA